jgi:hypothetical protein
MTHLIRSTACLLCGLLLTAAGDEAKNAGPNVNDLSMEVAALQALHYFRITPEQMKALRKIAAETSDQDQAARTAPKASEAYRKALQSLRDALIKGEDEERIIELEDELQELRDKEEPRLDDAIEVTDVARQKAPEVLRMLFARQVTAYLHTLGEDTPDPLETLLDALDQVRGLKPEEWKTLREDVQDQVGRLAGGLDEDKATRIGNEAVQFLIRVRLIKDEKEFQAARPELEKEARQLVGNIGPLEVMRNLAELGLAEMLSNPRLEKALAARLKQ